MIDKIIAYDLGEVERKTVLSEAKTLHRSKLTTEQQWTEIQAEFATTLYHPSLWMKVLLFVLTFIGLLSIIGPVGLFLSGIFDFTGEFAYRFVIFIVGIGIILFVEWMMIREKRHYKSGVIEAGIYTGFSFLAIAIIGFNPHNEFIYPFVGLTVALICAVRYLDLLSLVVGVGLFGWLLFKAIHNIGGTTEALMPFIFLGSFTALYFISLKLERKLNNIIFENQFVILKSLALALAYISVNYYVVRELSISLMGLKLTAQTDIPFAFLFYFFTVAIPIFYIFVGVKRKSLLFIRIGLLVLALAVATFKYYFSLGLPAVTLTVGGLILIGVSLWLFQYLKIARNGFTGEKLLTDKWLTAEVNAVIASQTLGGNKPDASENGSSFGGGRSGGGGSGGTW